jgi:hypothetical protein
MSYRRQEVQPQDASGKAKDKILYQLRNLVISMMEL